MAVVQFKSMYPQARRNLLLLTYKPVEVEMTSAMNKKSSLEDTPAVPSLSKGKLVEVEKPVSKSHEMKRPLLLTYRPLLLLTYKPVSEVKETSATQKISSGRKPLLLLTYEPIEVEKAKTTSVQPSTDSRSTPLLLTYKTVEVSKTFTAEKDSPAEPSSPSPVANGYADVVSETQCPGQTPGTPPVPATPELQLLELGQPPESPTATQTEGGLDLDLVESELAEESEEGRVEVFDGDVDALAEAFSAISLGCESQSIDWEVSDEEIDSLVEAFSAVTLGHEGESATVVVAGASVTLDLPTDVADIEEAELGAVVVYKDPSWVLGKRKAENEADSLYNRRFSKSVMVWENSSVASGFPKFYQRTTTSSKVPYRCLGDFRQRKGRSAFDQVDDERRRNAVIKAERAARISAALLNDVEMGSCDSFEYAGEPMELDF
ncbi:hypothetical protein CPC08DRAFT_711922 [Agrocybe pediades]|nr:hypothetical protein CPC08DRAFT_711922 [Agrocybe pediades]